MNIQESANSYLKIRHEGRIGDFLIKHDILDASYVFTPARLSLDAMNVKKAFQKKFDYVKRFIELKNESKKKIMIKLRSKKKTTSWGLRAVNIQIDFARQAYQVHMKYFNMFNRTKGLKNLVVQKLYNKECELLQQKYTNHYGYSFVK